LTLACEDFRDHLGYWFDEAARGEHPSSPAAASRSCASAPL
jgi:hypothetical protein